MAFEARDLVLDLSSTKVPPQPNPKPECETNTGITGGPVAEDWSPAPHCAVDNSKATSAGNDELAELRRQLRAALEAKAAA
jgi:hypothetical protein